MFVFNKSVENDYEKLQKEIAQLEIENKRLLFENQDLREKLKCESKTKEEFILTHGEYIIGEDIRPGRYSFKVIQGDDGMVETTGRDWKIIGIGNDFNQVMKYQNLSLKINTKLKIRGNIKLLFKREKPINIDDDMSLLEIKNKEIEKLKAELKDLKKKYEELKLQLNEKTFEDEYILKYGYYYGGENIALGIYDLKVLSGSGYVKERGNFHQMGNTQYGKMEMFGLKISNKTKIEVTNNKLVIRTTKNITTGSYQVANTTQAIDTEIDMQNGDIPIVCVNNATQTSGLIYVPCVKNNRWYVSVSTEASGGGPEVFNITILNTHK